MTGRELIVYILQNNLEDEIVFDMKTDKLIGHISTSEAAAKAGVGVGTIVAWIEMGFIDCVVIHGMYRIPANFIDRLPFTIGKKGVTNNG